jgi:Lysophospholipase L1 and related esterases
MNTLYILGDSTAAIKNTDKYPETGWGEKFAPYLAPGWRLENHAVNGRSTKSFIAEGRFERVLEAAECGDAVIIQFGHNDSKSDEARHSEPFSDYADNLVYMADGFRKKGVDVFFVTPIARRRFVDGIVTDTHGPYPAAMKFAAYRAGCPVVDMTIPTMVGLAYLGEKNSRRLYMNLEKGEYRAYPDGKEDNTHLTPSGAKWVASLLYHELCRLTPPPRFLREDCSEPESN